MRPWFALLVLAACGGGDKADSQTPTTGSTTSTATGSGSGAATGTGTGAATGTGTGATTGTGTGATTGTGTGATTGTGTGTVPTFPCGANLDCQVGETCYITVAATTSYACYPASPSCYGVSTCDCILCDQPGPVNATCTDDPGLGATCTQYP